MSELSPWPGVIFCLLLGADRMILPQRPWPKWGRHTAANLAVAAAGGAITFSVYALFPQAFAQPGVLARWTGDPRVKFLVACVLLDLWMYWWHRANHRVSWLWRLHRMHHRDAEMDVTTALRFHPLEIAISAVLHLGVCAVSGVSWPALVAYFALFQPVIFFHHSRVVLPSGSDALLRALVVSPAMHHLHHSTVRAETDSNYGSVFSFWDRMFGTYRYRSGAPVLGLPAGT